MENCHLNLQLMRKVLQHLDMCLLVVILRSQIDLDELLQVLEREDLQFTFPQVWIGKLHDIREAVDTLSPASKG